MANPLNITGAMGLGPPASGPLGPVRRNAPNSPGADAAGDGIDFKTLLLEKLDEVKSLQDEAGEGVKKLISGETQNVAEVFSAVHKADVAFSLLMEIRNKLMDAYEQLQQMRV